MKRSMDRGEFLQRFHPPKSLHRPLSSSERKMGILGLVIEPSAYLAAIQIAEFAHRCRVVFQPVGHNGFDPTVRFSAFFRKHEAADQSRFLVT